MGKLEYTITPASPGVRVVAWGVLDEATQLGDLLDRLEGMGEVSLDLRGIERANSIGLKRWIAAMESLTSRQRVVVEVCSVAMAYQAMMVRNIFGHAEVLSSEAPYFCVACERALILRITCEEVRAAADHVPEKACPHCGGATEFDELEGFLEFMT